MKRQTVLQSALTGLLASATQRRAVGLSEDVGALKSNDAAGSRNALQLHFLRCFWDLLLLHGNWPFLMLHGDVLPVSLLLRRSAEHGTSLQLEQYSALDVILLKRYSDRCE
jgi:hypothetical protein